MNFFNRAFKNVTRKLSKSVLLMITFFVIGNFVIVGLGVSSASENAKVLTRQKMRAVVTFEKDYDQFWKDADDIEDEEEREKFYEEGVPVLTNDFMNRVLTDERVKIANALSSSMMYASNFEPVPVGNEREENENAGHGGIIGPDGSEHVYVEPNISVIGNKYPGMIEFQDNMYVLEDGRMYDQNDLDDRSRVCLITNTLAENNGLRVGDTIKILTDQNYQWQDVYKEGIVTDEDFQMEFEIIGIFDNMAELDPSADNFDWMSKAESPENIVLVPSSALVEENVNLQLKMWDYWAKQFPEEEYYKNPDNKPTFEQWYENSYNRMVLLLNDPLEVDKFVEDYENEMPKYNYINANNDTFNELSKPLDTMSLFSNFIVWLVIINAIIIITLVTALTLKTREYEIGVSLAIGVSKAKIIAQFFVELAIIAVIGFSLSVVSGSLVAKQIGNKVLEYQVSVSDIDEEDDDDFYYWGETNYFTEITLEDMVSEYEVTISPIIIGEIYVAGLGIVLISILIPSLMIMRFNPKKILMNTN